MSNRSSPASLERRATWACLPRFARKYAPRWIICRPSDHVEAEEDAFEDVWLSGAESSSESAGKKRATPQWRSPDRSDGLVARLVDDAAMRARAIFILRPERYAPISPQTGRAAEKEKEWQDE